MLIAKGVWSSLHSSKSWHSMILWILAAHFSMSKECAGTSRHVASPKLIGKCLPLSAIKCGYSLLYGLVLLTAYIWAWRSIFAWLSIILVSFAATHSLYPSINKPLLMAHLAKKDYIHWMAP